MGLKRNRNDVTRKWKTTDSQHAREKETHPQTKTKKRNPPSLSMQATRRVSIT